MDWFLYDDGLRHERVKLKINLNFYFNILNIHLKLNVLLKLKSYTLEAVILWLRNMRFHKKHYCNFKIYEEKVKYFYFL